jgi:hypothetical protein
MAKMAPEQQALHGRHRRPRRDPPGTVHTFRGQRAIHLVTGIAAVVVGIGLLVGLAAALADPSSSWARGDGGVGTSGDAEMAIGGLLAIWLGIRLLRVGLQITAGKMTYRGYFWSRTVDAADIRAITLQPIDETGNGARWIPRVELTGGKGFWIRSLDLSRARKPPKPRLAAQLDDIRALLGITAEDMGRPENQPQADTEDAEAKRLLGGMVADSEDPDRALRGMIGQDRKAAAVTVSEDGLDETQARIHHIEAIIRKSLGGISAILWIFLIIAIPDAAAGETGVSLPTWLWWGIGIAGVMLALTVLAFRTNVPRRIAGIITTNSRKE